MCHHPPSPAPSLWRAGDVRCRLVKRYAGVWVVLLTAMALLFVLAEAWQIPVLADASPVQRLTGMVAALAGVTLLAVDAVLPVPSSVVMITHGARFGVALGAALSMVGSVASFAIGFALGRRGAALAARVVPDEERRKADRFLRRWGLVGIILTRPVPLLAETVSFVAGASPLRWPPALLSAALGCLPAAAVYAAAGTVATSLADGGTMFVAVLLLAAGASVLAARHRPPEADPREA